MKKDNLILEKSDAFAIRIINLYKDLCKNKKEFVISKKLLRSGTSIGANVKESVYAQSRADFIHKMSISLKEASETEYWLGLLYKTNYLTKSEFESFNKDNKIILRILIAIVKSSKQNP